MAANLLFWIAAPAIALAAAWVIARPLWRQRARLGAREATLAIYRDQLADIEAQHARGDLSDAERETASREVKRRLLAADRAGGRETPGRPIGRTGRLVAAGVILAVPLAAAWLYTVEGAPGEPDAPLASRTDEIALQARARAELARLVANAQAQIDAQGQDAPAEALVMLARGFEELGRYDEAAERFAMLAARAPEQARWSAAQGAALVAAGRGQVTPQALAAFREALRRDAGDPQSLYYLAVARLQAGDATAARAQAEALAATLPPDSEGRRLARELAVAAAEAGGEPPDSAAAPPLDAAARAAAAAMTPEEREEMIRAMVDGLSARLTSDGGDVAEWMRLGQARLVLGEAEAAVAAFSEAAALAPDDPQVAAALARAQAALAD